MTSSAVSWAYVDALRIIQDSAESTGGIESAKMHSYYGNCYICLAATSTANHDGGCSVRKLRVKHKGRDHRNNAYSVFVRPKVPHIMHRTAYPDKQSFPLLTRVWVSRRDG